jgi:hypothetical protein
VFAQAGCHFNKVSYFLLAVANLGPHPALFATHFASPLAFLHRFTDLLETGMDCTQQ